MDNKKITVQKEIEEIDEEIENTSAEEIEKAELSKEFKESVQKYIKIDDLIRKKRKEIKDLQDEKKPHETIIINYLGTKGENEIIINGGKLIRNQSETKQPITKDIMKDAIKKKVNNIDAVDDILKAMQELRPIKKRIYLKRTSKKTKK